MKPEKLKYWRAIVATLALLVVLLASPALADTVTWVGPTTNNWWSNPDNWDTGIVPVAGDDAFLTNGTTATVDATSPPLLNSVIVDGNFTATQTYYPPGNLSASAETIGLDGVGVYNHSAGSNTVGGAAAVNPLPAGTLDRTLVLGFRDGSSGTYNKNGGTLTTYDLIVGRAGTGTFNLSGNLTVNNNETIGNSATGVGTFQISYGDLSVGGNETIGFNGIGTFSHSSGNQTIGGSLLIGRNAGSSGTYTAGSADLSVGNTMFVGRGGTGVFSSSSGDVSITNNFIVGRLAGSSGSFTMSSGNLDVGGQETIGYEGIGIFSHSSGNHIIGGGLLVGRLAGSSGSFTMSSGNIEVGGNEVIGAAGDGSLIHTSGNHTVDGNFILGRDAGTTGNFTQTSGNLNIAGLADIGRNGTGTMTRTSGNTTTGGILTLAKNTGSSGTFNVTSGNVTSNNSPPFDGTADIVISGKAPNLAGGVGQLNINGGVTVTGDVVNNDTIKTTDADVTWNGDVVNNNAYISDPSTNEFLNDLTVNDPDGYIEATHNKDLFLIRGDFINYTTNSSAWNTVKARLRFAKGGVENDKMHEFYIVGADNGPGGTNEFAWRVLNITNQDITLIDGDGGGGGALYVNIIRGVESPGYTGGETLENIFNASTTPINIYYDSTFGLNGYLNNHDYVIPADPMVLGAVNGMLIAHTPLPPSVLLLGSGLLGLGLLGWRRKRS